MEENQNHSAKIAEKGEDRNAIYLKKGAPFKIVQLADLHFGAAEHRYCNKKMDETRAFLRKIADETNPDFMIATGDNILNTGEKGLSEFVSELERYGVAWTFEFGNHDCETYEEKARLHHYLLKIRENTKYFVYQDGFSDEQEGRYGNFSVKVYSGDDLRGAILLLDTGLYDDKQNVYESVSAAQTKWYCGEIDALQKEYQREGVIPTLMFVHLQLPQYYDAYRGATAGINGAEFVRYQKLEPFEIQRIKDGAGITDHGLFEKILEKKSTSAVFCGHAHNFDFQVRYKGVLLGFGPQTGFDGTELDSVPRETYLYTVFEDFSFTTTALFESDGKGLGVSGGSGYEK